MNLMRVAALSAMLITIMSCLCWADKEAADPIDRNLEECIAKDHTTAGMVTCAKDSIDAWDKELNVVYGKLMNRLDRKSKAALKKSQTQWIKYRDDQFAFIASYYDGIQGTMYVPMKAGDRAEVVKQRTINLRSYLKLLDTK